MDSWDEFDEPGDLPNGYDWRLFEFRLGMAVSATARYRLAMGEPYDEIFESIIVNLADSFMENDGLLPFVHEALLDIAQRAIDRIRNEPRAMDSAESLRKTAIDLTVALWAAAPRKLFE